MEASERNFIDEMTKMIIRPHRDIYALQKLGPTQLIVKRTSLNDKSSYKYSEVLRKDVAVDCRGKKIQLSYFSPADHERKQQPSHLPPNEKMRRCVVYLHANSGSRIEGLELVKYVLPLGWTMAIFDYRGSGLSEGEFTSMGVNESEDLEKVIGWLGTQERVGEFSLWGRSMGAVTILYYLTKQYFWNNLHTGVVVRSVVLDSPFSNMQKLMYEIGWNKISLPEFVFFPIVNSINDRVCAKIGVNLLKDLDLLDKIKQIKDKNPEVVKLLARISALFLTSLEDKLVAASHVESLHQAYPFHPSDIHYLNGQHNDPRSDATKTKCALFLCEQPLLTQDRETPPPAPNPYQPMRRSEMDFKKEEPKRDTQFLIAPAKKGEVGSPKFKSKKDMRVMTEETAAKPHKESIKTSKILDQERRTENSPTIIINNNYNVSVNLYDPSKPMEVIQEIIPPINFTRQDPFQGYMTDRLNDNHTHHKYYLPYTAKTDKKDHDKTHPFPNDTRTDKKDYHPAPADPTHHTFTYPSPPDKNFLTFSGKVEPSHYKGSPLPLPRDGRATHNPNGKLDIPRIKLEGIDYNVDLEEETKQKLTGRDLFERHRLQNDKREAVGTGVVGVSTGAIGDKSKLSLAQLRKMQKKEQEKCVMKVSKVISIKERWDNSEEEKLHPKVETYSYDSTNSHKDPKSDQLADFDAKPEKILLAAPRQMKSLKTSLMTKRKPGMERKNSETMDNLKTSFLNKKYDAEKNVEVGKVEGSPHKILQYKVRIDHL